MNMLNRITSEHQAMFDAQRAHMKTPEFLARTALLQQVADTLKADGFHVWHQICWSSCMTPDRDPPTLYLHIDIREEHKAAGTRRLFELIELIPGDTEYIVNGAAIELRPHASPYVGWKPAELLEAA